MPLTISLKKGQGFKIGERVFFCSDVGNEKHARGYYCDFTLTSEGEEFHVSDESSLILEPGVTVGVGRRRRPRGRLACIAIIAEGLRVSRLESCGTCKDSGFITVREGCLKCGGYGCSSCDGGAVPIKSVCPDCGEKAWK